MIVEYKFVDPIRLKEPSFQALLGQEYRMWIQNNLDLIATLALAAFQNDHLIALLVVDKHPLVQFGLIQSLEKLEAIDKHVINSLMRLMQEHIISQGATEWGAQYEQGSAMANYISDNKDWSEPYAKFRRYYFHLPDFNPSWFANPSPIPEGYTLTLWDKLSQNQRNQIEKWSRNSDILISSNSDPHPREYLNSLILWFEGNIAGWMETHRLNDNSVRYTTLFLFPEHRMLTLAAPLLAASIRIQKNSPLPIAIFDLNLRETPLSWKNFISKRLAPHAYIVKEIDYSFKLLNEL